MSLFCAVIMLAFSHGHSQPTTSKSFHRIRHLSPFRFRNSARNRRRRLLSLM